MADVRIDEPHAASIVQIATWPAEADTVASMLEAAFGIAPPSVGYAAGSAGQRLMGLSPGRWLLVADDFSWPARLAAAFAKGEAAVTNLSAARAVFRVSGPEVLTLLRQGIDIDLHPAAFPPGRCAQTLLHHMGVLLHRQDDSCFNLHVSRSFGRSLREWLHDAS